MNGTTKSPAKALAKIFKGKGRILCYILCIILTIIAVISVQRAWNYSAVESENRELRASLAELEGQMAELEQTQAELADSEKEVRLLKESTNALKAQVAGLNAEKEDLNNQLEELLRVKDTVPEITTEILDDEITSLSELVTKKYWYRNATERTEGQKWLWGIDRPFSNIKFVALYDGCIYAGINIKEVKFAVDQTKKTITVTMPESEIFDHNIPQETINVLEAKDGLFNKVGFNEYNQFISEAKMEMEETDICKELLAAADEEAKRIIEAFLKTIPGIDQYKIIFK